MATDEFPYEQLPQEIKHNLTEEQWEEARYLIIREGDLIPEKTEYINLRTGRILGFEQGQVANGPLLATHNLSGAHGKDSDQFRTAPRGAVART